jgi:hypothetical protein
MTLSDPLTCRGPRTLSGVCRYHVAQDLLSLRVTCKTLREAVAPFLPVLEARLRAEAYGTSEQKPVMIRGRPFTVYTRELHDLLKADQQALAEARQGYLPR